MHAMLVRIATAEALGADVVDAVPELERTADSVLSGTLVDRADLNRVLTTLRRLRAKVVSVDVAPDRHLIVTSSPALSPT